MSELSAEVALKAADLLDRSKWAKGLAVRSPGEMCMMEAVEEETFKATSEDEAFDEIYGDIERAISTAIGAPKFTSGTYYNDHVAKRKRDAVSMLRKAANLLSKE